MSLFMVNKGRFQVIASPGAPGKDRAAISGVTLELFRQGRRNQLDNKELSRLAGIPKFCILHF